MPGHTSIFAGANAPKLTREPGDEAKHETSIIPTVQGLILLVINDPGTVARTFRRVFFNSISINSCYFLHNFSTESLALNTSCSG